MRGRRTTDSVATGVRGSEADVPGVRRGVATVLGRRPGGEEHVSAPGLEAVGRDSRPGSPPRDRRLLRADRPRPRSSCRRSPPKKRYAQYLCFRITGYRPSEGSPRLVLEAEDIRNDLRLLMHRGPLGDRRPESWSRRAGLTVDAVSQLQRLDPDRQPMAVPSLVARSEGRTKIGFLESEPQAASAALRASPGEEPGSTTHRRGAGGDPPTPRRPAQVGRQHGPIEIAPEDHGKMGRSKRSAHHPEDLRPGPPGPSDLPAVERPLDETDRPDPSPVCQRPRRVGREPRHAVRPDPVELYQILNEMPPSILSTKLEFMPHELRRPEGEGRDPRRDAPAARRQGSCGKVQGLPPGEPLRVPLLSPRAGAHLFRKMNYLVPRQRPPREG